jgi:hydroxymethylpyrimidine pyrophosphatase-like HAD family hydrolase
MMHPEANKGSALKFLADKLRIKREEVMAIGDSNNDMDMLEFAGWGVAMANASDYVKSKAQAVTAHHDADGVAEAIDTYIISAS